MKGIADTGFIVAFANRNDRYHRWALGIAETLSEPLLTCEAVIAEASFHLNSTEYVLSLVKEQLLSIVFDGRENIDQIYALAKRYRDRSPDFADLCLIRMSELYPKHTVITTDVSDFNIYRRFKREKIPILTPNKN